MSGGGTAYLTGALAGRWQYVERNAALGTAVPRVAGQLAEFAAAHPAVAHQCRNLVRKCAQCGKCCAAIAR